MTTERNLFKEFAICSVDELGDEKNQKGRDHVNFSEPVDH